MIPVALSIAGSDPSGGAGIQADLKTFHQFDVFGEAAITLLTVQNTAGVTRVQCLEPELVVAQIQAVIDDIPPNAAKLGALGCRNIVEVISALARSFRFPLVIDPVMISKHGAPLMDSDARDALRSLLLPECFLVTPNLAEAEALTGKQVSSIGQMREAARALVDLGANSVLIKGGHLESDATDILLHEGHFHEYAAQKIATHHTHGTGCTYSAAITAEIAGGMHLIEAIRRAKAFITEAIRTNPGLGSGAGPVNFHARP